MGLLESAIGGVLGQVFGNRGGSSGGGQSSGGAMAPLVKALLMLLLAKGASGGFGDIFGQGRGQPAGPGPDADRPGPDPRGAGRRDPGDIGGFDQYGGRREPAPDTGSGMAGDASLPPGDFSDLSGMLDGPGGPGGAPARAEASGGDLGGLDGLVDRFRQGGLGDVMESWIGHGTNHPVALDQLARALGPDTLDTLQGQTGMDRDSLLAQLSQALPEVVHALTPQGRVPDVGERRGW